MLLDDVGLTRRGRHFMCGSTGSGKSTFSEALIDGYHSRYPRDWLYFIDPKHRFSGVSSEDQGHIGGSLFPEGYKERPHGRRDSVAVRGRVVRRPASGPEEGESEVIILQDDDAIYAQLDWLYHNSSVETPTLIYADESFEFMRGSRADPRVRRLLQQGREIGIGTLIINQRPHWIDATMLSESEVFYIGTLHDYRDREALIPHCQGTPLVKYLQKPMPLHRWLYVNRVQWNKSKVFDLEIN